VHIVLFAADVSLRKTQSYGRLAHFPGRSNSGCSQAEASPRSTDGTAYVTSATVDDALLAPDDSLATLSASVSGRSQVSR
jgi:hypothetical protein